MWIFQRLSKFIDITFVLSVIFILILIWSKFFINNIIISIFLSVCLTLTIGYFLTKKQNIYFNNSKQQKNFNKLTEDFTIYFLTSKIKNIQELFLKKNNALFVKDGLLQDEENIYYIYNNAQKFSKEQLFSIIKVIEQTDKTINIIASSYDNKNLMILNSIQNYKIKLLSVADIVKKFDLKAQDYILKINFLNNNIQTIKQFILLFFREENAKGYFISALFLILGSLIVPQKLYYYIFSSLLLILSLICKIKPNKTNEKS